MSLIRESTGSRALLCYGCNERRDPELKICPDCGGRLVLALDVDLLATRTLTETTRPGASWAKDDLVGTSVGPYDIKALAGQGGMGRVYRAHHQGLGRTCAIKILNPALVRRRPRYARMFVQEGRAAAALVHPNVVTVHNIAEIEDLWMIEMEWVDGAPLNHYHEGETSAFRATQLMLMMASGLGEAHRRGIVHRDLKPSNVLVNTAGLAKLADFGLAKHLVAEAARESAGDLAGTPYFMAPELFRGESATPASDIYAAGVTYFYLLTGHYPFQSEDFLDLVRLHREQEIPRLDQHSSEIPRRAQLIVERCLAKDPALRYEHADQLFEDLQSLLASIRSIEDLVSEALAGLGLSFKRNGPGFEVNVPLPDDRHQVVTIEETRSEFSGERLVRVWSPCGPVDDAYLQRALEINGEVYHGALAIQDHQGARYFVMRNNYPRATCDPGEIRSSLLAIAQRSDDVEAMLTGADRH